MAGRCEPCSPTWTTPWTPSPRRPEEDVQLVSSTDELRVESLQQKACALLGIWSAPTRPDVRVGDADLATDLLISTAALEITVHGWDVGQATGKGDPIPEGLARALLPVAHQVVDDADRGIRFGSPCPVSDEASYDERLRAISRPSGPTTWPELPGSHHPP